MIVLCLCVSVCLYFSLSLSQIAIKYDVIIGMQAIENNTTKVYSNNENNMTQCFAGND